MNVCVKVCVCMRGSEKWLFASFGFVNIKFGQNNEQINQIQLRTDIPVIFSESSELYVGKTKINVPAFL